MKKKRIRYFVKAVILALTVNVTVVTSYGMQMIDGTMSQASIIAYGAIKKIGTVDDGVTSLRIRSSIDTSSTANVITKVDAGFQFDVLEEVESGSWYRIGFEF